MYAAIFNTTQTVDVRLSEPIPTRQITFRKCSLGSETFCVVPSNAEEGTLTLSKFVKAWPNDLDPTRVGNSLNIESVTLTEEYHKIPYLAVIPLHIDFPSFSGTLKGRIPRSSPPTTNLARTIPTRGTPPNGSVGGIYLQSAKH